jgi:hypothetical protein
MNTKSKSPRISRSAFLRSLALGGPALTIPALMAQSEHPASPAPEKLDLGNLRAFVELARSDIRTQKALIVAENIPFTNDEAVEFWPLHREYELELNKLLDLRYAGILEFCNKAGNLTDAAATDLAEKAFDLEAKRTELKRTYFKKFRKVIPAVKAARFFQIENQINMAIDLQIAASLPLIK